MNVVSLALSKFREKITLDPPPTPPNYNPQGAANAVMRLVWIRTALLVLNPGISITTLFSQSNSSLIVTLIS